MQSTVPPDTTFKIPEPLEWGKIHRNCGYCGHTFFHTLLKHQDHIHKCELNRLEEFYGKQDKPNT